jgi:hypothetical protein
VSPNPGAHAEQTEFVAFVHVVCPTQFATGAHAGQMLPPSSVAARYLPLWQALHTESVAFVHCWMGSGSTQPATAEQGTQAEAGPLLSSHIPLPHCVHCEFVALEQVSVLVQPGTGVQLSQALAGPLLSR